MNSPVNLFKESVQIDKSLDQPVYLQIQYEIIRLIKDGYLSKGVRLPGSRTMAEQLNVHRKTIVSALDELLSQGWVQIIPSKGTFVSDDLPEIQIDAHNGAVAFIEKEFEFDRLKNLRRDTPSLPKGLTLDEGIPDVRIAPVKDILREYRSIISRERNLQHLNYGSTYGDSSLREVLVDYLQETRGLTTTPEQILITRGSQMGMYLASQLIHSKGGYSVVGETNYLAANLTLIHSGAELLTVSVDKNGLVVDEVEELCKRHKILSVYVTSHHHHPTTVTMSAQRRLELLELSSKYCFAILEDDYDFDFHFQRSPKLPLASLSKGKNVVYMGALCKIVAPAIRVGYMVASEEFIATAAELRRIIDRQGDAILEKSIAQMIKQGDIQRHSRKALKLYHERRNHFCDLLRNELNEYLSFKDPEGGMAVWVILNEKFSWKDIRAKCDEMGLAIPEHLKYDSMGLGHNGVRFGFASLDLEEQKEVVSIIKKAFEEF